MDELLFATFTPEQLVTQRFMGMYRRVLMLELRDARLKGRDPYMCITRWTRVAYKPKGDVLQEYAKETAAWARRVHRRRKFSWNVIKTLSDAWSEVPERDRAAWIDAMLNPRLRVGWLR